MEDHLWLIVVVLGVLVLIQLASIAKSLARLAASSAETTGMLKRRMSHQGIEWGSAVEPSDQVKTLALDTKRYVDAIKAYREQTGVGLREAKAVVDRLSRAPQRVD